MKKRVAISDGDFFLCPGANRFKYDNYSAVCQ